jgi:hypothetical protein
VATTVPFLCGAAKVTGRSSSEVGGEQGGEGLAEGEEEEEEEEDDERDTFFIFRCMAVSVRFFAFIVTPACDEFCGLLLSTTGLLISNAGLAVSALVMKQIVSSMYAHSLNNTFHYKAKFCHLLNRRSKRLSHDTHR